MDIERMHEVIEKLSECAKCEFDKGIENVDTAEMSAVTGMLKDISMAMYYRVLTNSMLDSDTEEIMEMFDRYGDDRRFYNHYHYKNGRFAPKGHGTYRRGYEEPHYHMTPDMLKEHTAEYWRDKDRDKGIMYYTEPMNTDKNADVRNAESRYDRAKRMYTETKEMHKSGTSDDKTITLREGEKFLNVFFDELDEIMKDASPEMKSMIKTKGMARMQKIQ